MKFAFPLAATAALALAACSSEEPAPDTAPSPTGALAEADALAASALPTTAQAFIDTASSSDLYEIEAGKLAQANGKSQAVKDFGQVMETAHATSTADLRAAAGQVEGVTVEPRLDPEQQADLEALRTAGDNFDRVYKTQMLSAHQRALSLLQNFAAAGDAQPLKDFASKTAPVVQSHLDNARELP